MIDEDGTPTGSRERALDSIRAVALGDPPVFTREEVAAAAGMTLDQARPYWRAMGFADVGEARAFTAADAQALTLLAGWVDAGLLDEPTTMEVVRSLGQTTSRLADWQVHTLARVLSESESPVDLNEVAHEMAGILPGLETLLLHVWRRHLAAAVGAGLAFVGDEPQGPAGLGEATIGFADIAGFTRLTRVLRDDELAQMVQAFETGAADIVAAHGARLVKTLGDEVMFVAERADDALAIADELHELSVAGQEPLELRIGLATGRLVSQMGDFYGATVNRASRLTAIARRGSTLIDPATEHDLADRSRHVLRHLAPRPVRGMGLVRATSVSRRRTRETERPEPT